MRKGEPLYPILLLTCCLALSALNPVSAQLAARFSSDTTQGCAPLVVRFKDESTGSPTSWKWDLGNGTISYFQNPAATYFNPGTYTVKLVVSNGSQSDSVVKTGYITVFAAPTLNLIASDTSGCFPLDVQFTDLSTAGDGTIASWLWDFGDGSTDTVQHPHHMYVSQGNYNVSLQVKNSRGCIGTLTKIQYIKLNDGVKADFTFNAPNNCRPPTPVSFSNHSTGTGILSYQWDFGDGGTSLLANPTHIYNTPGTYTVRLIVRNNRGCVDTLVRAQAITIGTVNADFSAPATVCEGTGVLFTNTSAPNPASAFWDFGDGTISTALNPVKVFTAPGNFTVKLVSNFGACRDSISKPIVVLPKPVAAFTGVNTTACQPPLTTTFNSNVAGAVSYKWYFGDGDSAATAQPTHTYTSAGIFDVTLIVTNAAGCTDTLRRNDFVQIRRPVVSVTNVPKEGCAPLAFQPIVSISSVDPIVSWSWDFGDGSTATGLNPIHTYINPGTYTLKVVFTTAGGCTDSLTIVNAVRVGIKLQPNFSATPRFACAFQPIHFSDLSTGGVADSWFWEFGDGGTSIEQNPIHLYQDTGYFTVTLVVANNGCRDTLRIVDYIRIKPPIARFIDSSGCTDPFTRKFIDRSIGALTWHWDFGDGNTSNQQNPVHTYSAPGAYMVQLTVRNDTCEHITQRQIHIIAEVPDFVASDTVICKGSVVTFSTRNINTAHISMHSWSFGDGIVQNGGSQINHIYTASGNYTVRLVIRDINGCLDTLIKPLYIRVYGPDANFTVITPGVCLDSAVLFNDASTSDGVHPITAWIWEYGDGQRDSLTGPPYQHVYNTAGQYTVRLIVVDNIGCRDTITRPNSVIISKPEAIFGAVDTVTCVDKSIRFVSTSTGPGLTYHWDFGDGQSTVQNNPLHAFSAEGLYTISLAIKDVYGCTDTLVKPQYITVRNPVAQFSISDSVSSCPPLVVNFTNQSQHFISHEWDFGDGTKSSLQNPLHFYTYPGTYRAKLTVVGVGGCIDSLVKTIVVRGPQGTFSYDRNSGCVPTTVKFIAQTKDQVSFIWDFNDGTTVHTGDSSISHTYTQMGEYLPKMILRDPQGCQVPIVGRDTIRIYGVNAALGMSQRVVCDSGRVFFRDSSLSNDLITGYYWTFGDGTVSTLQHPSHVYTQSGQYPISLVVTTQHNCRDTADNIAPLRIVPSPAAGITGDTAACVPALLDFNGQLLNQDTSVLQWRWDFGNNTYSSLKDPAAVTYQQAGNYNVRLILTNSSGCDDTAYYPVWARPLPVIQAPGDLTICRYQSTPLVATGGMQYNWQPADGLSCIDCPNPTAAPDSNRLYAVQGKNIFGCTAVDSVLITVKQPFSMRTASGDTLCKGESYMLSASGAELYAWTPITGLDNPALSNPKARPDTTVMYRVVGRDTHNCFTDTGYVPVVVYPYPLVDAGKDQTITVGTSVQLTPMLSADVKTVRWWPDKWIDCVTCPQPVASPKQTTKYTLEVANQGGCVTRDDVTLFVVCVEGNLFMPNTFSPNGDGMNDVFYPRGKGIYGVKSFRVFNRWGEMVFEQGNFQTNDITKGWNGTYKGKLASQDVYVYTIDVVCENNQVFSFKGNIALIR
ncbi:MAG TPA: PKD domain-containing protein [Chitinophagaceae bacterium]|nr:PKD domain-containing protein [Chitinophagaceae bacterium]